MSDAEERSPFEDLAEEWYAAWNGHDLDRIVSHYRDDVHFTSPFVIALTGDPAGHLEGRDALRAYFGRALARFPDLRFQPIALMSGVRSAVLHYVSVQRRLAAETIVVDGDGLIVETLAHYGPPDSADG